MTHEHIVEMDAMDVAEWEKDRLTPLAPDAHLAALVKETAPKLPELPPAARKTATIARAPSPPPAKSGPIPRITPAAMAAVKPPVPTAQGTRTTAARVAARPKKPTQKSAPVSGKPAEPVAAKPIAAKPAISAAATPKAATPPPAPRGTARSAPVSAPVDDDLAIAVAPTLISSVPTEDRPTSEPVTARVATTPRVAAAPMPRPVTVFGAPMREPSPEQVAAPAPERTPTRERVTSERAAVSAAHTPMPERVVPSDRVAATPEHVPAQRVATDEPVTSERIPSTLMPAARHVPSTRASSVDEDWFGEGEPTRAANQLYTPTPAPSEPAPLPPPPAELASPPAPIQDVPVQAAPIQAAPIQPAPIQPTPAEAPIRALPERIALENPEYDWTPRPGTAPGPDEIVAAVAERSRSTDSLPAVGLPRSRRPFVIFGGAAVVIAVIVLVAISGGGSQAPVALAPLATATVPQPAIAPVATPPATAPVPAVAIAAVDPETTPATVEPVPPAKRPIATRRFNRAQPKKVVLEYDHPAAPVQPPGDDASVARARGAYSSGNQRLFAGDPEGAIQFYRQALTFYPGYVAGYRGLGLAFAQQGDKPKALQALRSYVVAVPNAKDVALIKARIARLQK